MYAETTVRIVCIFKSDRNIYRNTFYSVNSANSYKHTIRTLKRIAAVHRQHLPITQNTVVSYGCCDFRCLCMYWRGVKACFFRQLLVQQNPLHAVVSD